MVEVLKRYGLISRSDKIQRKSLDTEYYTRESKHIKVNVRKAYNRRKLGHQYQEQIRLSKQLLLAKESAHESFSRSIQKNEGKGWT